MRHGRSCAHLPQSEIAAYAKPSRPDDRRLSMTPSGKPAGDRKSLSFSDTSCDRMPITSHPGPATGARIGNPTAINLKPACARRCKATALDRCFSHASNTRRRTTIIRNRETMRSRSPESPWERSCRGPGRIAAGMRHSAGQSAWWCPRRESNSHTLRRRILNPLRLPFRHSGHAGTV